MSSRPPATPRSPAVPLLVLALLILAALTGPVRAAEGDRPLPPPVDLDEDAAWAAMDDVIFEHGMWDLDPILDAQVIESLLLEIAVLHHVGALRPVAPPVVDEIHDRYAPWPISSNDTVLSFLFEVDDELADLKNEVNRQVGLSPIVEYALDELPTADRDRLLAGETGFVDHAAYLGALSEFLSFGNGHELVLAGAPQAPLITELPFALLDLAGPSRLGEMRAAEPDEPMPAVASDPTAAALPATAASTNDAATGGSDLPWLPAAAGLGGLLPLVIAIAVIRRRRPAATTASDAPVTELVFEAHRRLAAAVDESEISEIARSTAVAITGASDAFIFRQTREGLRRVGDTTIITNSALTRVVETAQPLVAILDGDAAVNAAAVCAVPLVSERSVIAVLVARRPSAQPFGDEDRRRLEMLAPALGAALSSADTLGSYEHMALVDGLTSLGNRRRLDGDLETTLRQAVAEGLPVAFAMIDVDHFKHFNDTNGHGAGDEALRLVARVIADTVRSTDIVYRYGGEEFSVLLPGATPEEAGLAAERMCAAVAAARIDGEESQPGGRLTVSVGVSTLESGGPTGLKSRADDALYRAKAEGRNRAVLA